MMHLGALAMLQFVAERTPRALPETVSRMGWTPTQARSEKGPARAARKARKLVKMTGGKFEKL